MLRIRAGHFTHYSHFDIRKGSRFERVTLSSDYWLSDCEVPIDLYMRFLLDDSYQGDKPNDPQWSHAFDELPLDGRHPAQNVNWYDAVMFCNWLSRKEGLPVCYNIVPDEQTPSGHIVELSDNGGYRLPTEVEWEYACRAGTTAKFTCGDDLQRLREFAVFGATRTEPIGTRLFNRWGLFDVHGNVVEWCWDKYYDNFDGKQEFRPPGESQTRVARGGSWQDEAIWCQSSYRRGFHPVDRNFILGFRLAAGHLFLREMAQAIESKSTAR